ncbi:MAG: hypothetical protein R3B89_21040 [Polyangiaceae bacterium]
MNSWVGRRQSLLSHTARAAQFNISDAVEFSFTTARGTALIASYIRERIARFDRLTSSAESAVDLLQERRTALISAAVTGKIDVRNWKAPDARQEVA